MRIIGGQYKGRRIHVPSKGWPVRPTTDFAREALFNILDNRMEYESIKALDLFGGTGMHAIELVSRGCENVTFVDKYRESVRYMSALVKSENWPIKVVLSDVRKFIKEAVDQWDYIFADPPYDMPELETLPALILQSGVLSEKGLIVLEHTSKIHLQHQPGFTEARHYGQTVFSFFAAGS